MVTKSYLFIITEQLKELVTEKQREIEILQQKLSMLSIDKTCVSQQNKGGSHLSMKCMLIRFLF